MSSVLPEPDWAQLDTIGATARVEGITLSPVDGGCSVADFESL